MPWRLAHGRNTWVTTYRGEQKLALFNTRLATVSPLTLCPLR
jgi:hypothetical protein